MSRPPPRRRWAGPIRAGLIALLLLGPGARPGTGWAASGDWAPPGEQGYGVLPSWFPAAAAVLGEVPS